MFYAVSQQVRNKVKLSPYLGVLSAKGWWRPDRHAKTLTIRGQIWARVRVWVVWGVFLRLLEEFFQRGFFGQRRIIEHFHVNCKLFAKIVLWFDFLEHFFIRLFRFWQNSRTINWNFSRLSILSFLAAERVRYFDSNEDLALLLWDFCFLDFRLTVIFCLTVANTLKRYLNPLWIFSGAVRVRNLLSFLEEVTHRVEVDCDFWSLLNFC